MGSHKVNPPSPARARDLGAYDVTAAKQTVSLTVNSDLYEHIKRLGINASQIAEKALAEELARRMAQQAAAEIERDLEASNAYTAKHGSFAELVREHYGRRGDD